jgi:hypothetical protein
MSHNFVNQDFGSDDEDDDFNPVPTVDSENENADEDDEPQVTSRRRDSRANDRDDEVNGGDRVGHRNGDDREDDEEGVHEDEEDLADEDEDEEDEEDEDDEDAVSVSRLSMILWKPRRLILCLYRVVHARREGEVVCGLSSRRKLASTKMTKMPKRKRTIWAMDLAVLTCILTISMLSLSVQRWTIADTGSLIVNENLRQAWTRKSRLKP